ncbi:hypothetical protein THIOM_003343, partial [Candidatus Thiomargarita nelsonii]
WINIPTTANEWHHVAYVFDVQRATFRLYYDGGFITEEPAPTYIAAHTGGDAIGAMIVQTKLHTGDILNGLYFNGVIDDIYVYDRALSSTEIQALYKGDDSEEPPVPNNPCMATYSFDGQLHIPCVAVPGPFGGTMVYDVNMELIPLTNPFEFRLINVVPVQ